VAALQDTNRERHLAVNVVLLLLVLLPLCVLLIKHGEQRARQSLTLFACCAQHASGCVGRATRRAWPLSALRCSSTVGRKMIKTGTWKQLTGEAGRLTSPADVGAAMGACRLQADAERRKEPAVHPFTVSPERAGRPTSCGVRGGVCTVW